MHFGINLTRATQMIRFVTEIIVKYNMIYLDMAIFIFI